MTSRRSAMRRVRGILLVTALVLPALSLVPLGSLWLWEHGYIVYWAIGSCLVVTAIYGLERRLLGPVPSDVAPEAERHDPGETHWSPRQAEAWEDVMRLAQQVKVDRIGSRDAALNLALEAIETVARRLHPERKDPLLQFTVPEALAVMERASANLRRFVVSSFPLGDRVTVAQLMWLYRWRGALQLAEKGYDLWRVVRLLNPVAAATQELRERFTRQIYDMGRDHVARRLARAYVREVGRAAIDLYGGNLRIAAERLDSHVTAASRNDLTEAAARELEPVRILVAGQIGAGKSSLVNALANEVEAAVDALPATAKFAAYELSREGLPAALIVDSPGLGDARMIDDLIAEADDCDMLLWVCSAARAARDIDSRALSAIREHFAGQPHRHAPPMVLVLTHVDALRPFNEWAPPYDLTSGAAGKAQAIRGAMEAAGVELGFAAREMVPVRVDVAAAAYNIDAVWAKIVELMPDAKRARLLRTLRDVKSASNWGAIWSQAANAGRVIGDTFLTRSPNP